MRVCYLSFDPLVIDVFEVRWSLFVTLGNLLHAYLVGVEHLPFFAQLSCPPC
jgi:hypothetical protein